MHVRTATTLVLCLLATVAAGCASDGTATDDGATTGEAVAAPFDGDLEALMAAFVSHAEAYEAEYGRLPETTDEYFHDEVLPGPTLPDGASFGLSRTIGDDGEELAAFCVSLLLEDQVVSWQPEDGRGIVPGTLCEER